MAMGVRVEAHKYTPIGPSIARRLLVLIQPLALEVSPSFNVACNTERYLSVKSKFTQRDN